MENSLRKDTRMNLLNLMQSQLAPQSVSQISNIVGEGPDQTKSALGTAIPALLGALAGKATSSSMGANDVFNLIKQNQGTLPDAAGSWLNQAASGAATSGGSILNSLLGSKLGSVVDFLSGNSGIKSSSASSILGLAAPLIMGFLGKHVASQGLGASGLAQLLGSQAPFLKDAIPSGLANTLGLGKFLGGDTAKIETAREPAYQKYGRPVDREP